MQSAVFARKETVGASSRIFGLDLLRTFAISMVVAAHSSIFFDANKPSTWLHYLGLQGVELFFALSGFLIGTILLRNELNSGRDLWSFYLRRWIRTLPAFYVALTILYFFYQPDKFALLTTATFTGNVNSKQLIEGVTFFPVSWSLAVEEWFYLFLGLLTFTLGSRFKTVLTIWALVVVGRALYLAHLDQPSYDIAHSMVWLRFDALTAGLLAARIRFSWSEIVERKMLVLRGIYILGICIGAYIFTKHPWIQYRSSLIQIIGLPINSLCMAMLVFDLSKTPALLERMAGWGGSIVKRVVVFISLISYSLYLYHIEAMHIGEKYGGKNTESLILSIGLAICLATLSYYFVEKPFLRLRDVVTPSRPQV